MIIVGHGNLLSADAEALVNAVNTVGVMGKGIALQFKRAHPANYTAYRSACAAGEVPTGPDVRLRLGSPGPRQIRDQLCDEGITGGPARSSPTSRRALPISCGWYVIGGSPPWRCLRWGAATAGSTWSEVRPAVERAFAELPEVRVLLFPPEAASEAPISR